MKGKTFRAATPPPEPAVETAPSRQFRKRPTFKILAPDVVARHGQAATLAFRALGGSQAATEFLNAHNAVLDGRPLDMAGASADGLAAVRKVLEAMSEDRKQADAVAR